MVQCITSVRCNLLADVRRQGYPDEENIDVGEGGFHRVTQDPITKEILREWVPVVEEDKAFSVKCDVRGIIDGGIRVAGTTERFDNRIYNNVDFAHMFTGANVVISKRDRVTNVRNAKSGNIIWVEEELNMVDGNFPPTVFGVLGVTPITDAWGNHIENKILLQREDITHG